MEPKLNPKQKLFCQHYATHGETFGNAVKSYASAYGYDLSDERKYKTAKANAHELLQDFRINTYIRELLSEYELTHDLVNKELQYLILQNENLASKMQAISLFYKVYGRVKEPAQVDGGSILTKRARELANKYTNNTEL